MQVWKETKEPLKRGRKKRGRERERKERRMDMKERAGREGKF